MLGFRRMSRWNMLIYILAGGAAPAPAPPPDAGPGPVPDPPPAEG